MLEFAASGLDFAIDEHDTVACRAILFYFIFFLCFPFYFFFVDARYSFVAFEVTIILYFFFLFSPCTDYFLSSRFYYRDYREIHGEWRVEVRC